MAETKCKSRCCWQNSRYRKSSSDGLNHPTPSGLNGTNTWILTGTATASMATVTTVKSINLENLTLSTPAPTARRMARGVVKT